MINFGVWLARVEMEKHTSAFTCTEKIQIIFCSATVLYFCLPSTPLKINHRKICIHLFVLFPRKTMSNTVYASQWRVQVLRWGILWLQV